MKPNGFQAFTLEHNGTLKAKGDPKVKIEEVEQGIKIPKDLMGDKTYVVLPVYTNKLPERDPAADMLWPDDHLQGQKEK